MLCKLLNTLIGQVNEVHSISKQGNEKTQLGIVNQRQKQNDGIEFNKLKEFSA